MEISCLPTSLCQAFFQKDYKYNLTGAFYQPNRDGPLSIIDLNDDCLAEIFIHLNLKQLYNVVTVHVHFLPACRHVFFKKFSNKEITISAHQITQPDYTKVLNWLGDIILNLCVTYDRCDGHEHGHGHGNFNRTIHEAIVCHCSDTLVEITFNHIRPTMEINKPFQNLKKLKFNHGCVGRTLSKFNKWFPKLVSLQFFFCKTEDIQCIEQHFPNLEHFTVAHHNFRIEHLCTFLDLNQQLKSFAVYGHDRSLIRQLDEYTKLKFKALQTKFEIYPCYLSFDND